MKCFKVLKYWMEYVGVLNMLEYWIEDFEGGEKSGLLNID